MTPDHDALVRHSSRPGRARQHRSVPFEPSSCRGRVGLRDRRRRRQVDPGTRTAAILQFDAWRQVGRRASLAAGWCGRQRLGVRRTHHQRLSGSSSRMQTPATRRKFCKESWSVPGSTICTHCSEQETVTWSEHAVVRSLCRVGKALQLGRHQSARLGGGGGQRSVPLRSGDLLDALGGHGTVTQVIRRSSPGSVGKALGIPNSPRPRQRSGQERACTAGFPAMWHGWTRNLFQLYGQGFFGTCFVRPHDGL